jgi:hypothetical protein
MMGKDSPFNKYFWENWMQTWIRLKLNPAVRARWQIVDISKPKSWLTTLKKRDCKRHTWHPITSGKESPHWIHKWRSNYPQEEWKERLTAQPYQSASEVSTQLHFTVLHGKSCFQEHTGIQSSMLPPPPPHPLHTPPPSYMTCYFSPW